MGLPLVSPRDAAQRGGSVMLALPAHVPAAAVLAAFRANGIYADARSQTLRLSPGVMTTKEGVATMLQVLQAATKA